MNSLAAWAASAGITGICLLPLGTFFFWASSPHRTGQRSQPVKVAHVFLRLALPSYIVGVTLATVSFSIVASSLSGRSPTSRALLAATYTSLASDFVVTAASITTTSTIYLSGICAIYLELARQKWWTYLRLDAICGAALLLVLDIVWWARNLSDVRSGRGDGTSLAWLLVIIDIALCLIAAGTVGVAIYVAPKLRNRDVGNLPTLLLSASFLWLLRCTFVLAVHLKTVLFDWDQDELSAQKFVYPVLDYWVSATVLGLITFILRNPVWSDPAAIPDRQSEQRQTVVQYPGYLPHPQYGYQPPPHMYTQHPQMFQQYPQQETPQPGRQPAN